MPLDDPRLICPRCGKLVEIEVERFEDLFDEAEGPLEPGEEILPTYHAVCPPSTLEEKLAAPRGPGHGPDGPGVSG